MPFVVMPGMDLGGKALAPCYAQQVGMALPRCLLWLQLGALSTGKSAQACAATSDLKWRLSGWVSLSQLLTLSCCSSSDVAPRLKHPGSTSSHGCALWIQYLVDIRKYQTRLLRSWPYTEIVLHQYICSSPPFSNLHVLILGQSFTV